MTAFSDVVAAQKEFESLFVDFERIESGDTEYLDSVADYFAKCLTKESMEFLDEFNWKQHVSAKKLHNYDKQVGEAIDCFTFSLNMLLILGLDAAQIQEYYFLKNHINWDRQVDEGRATHQQAETAKSRYLEVH